MKASNKSSRFTFHACFMDSQPVTQSAKTAKPSLLRSVDLPDDVRGNLYLHSMPGRFEPYQATLDAIRMKGVSKVACLTSMDEIEAKSPEYAQALQRNDVSWVQETFPIVDFGVPADRARFRDFVDGLADDLRGGTNLLMHCAAGIGRTGTVASCVLVALGLSPQEAVKRVEAAGSHPERPEQLELINWVAAQTASRPAC